MPGSCIDDATVGVRVLYFSRLPAILAVTAKEEKFSFRLTTVEHVPNWLCWVLRACQYHEVSIRSSRTARKRLRASAPMTHNSSKLVP